MTRRSQLHASVLPFSNQLHLPRRGREASQKRIALYSGLIRFALNTGLRVGEIFSLRWFDVDWENNVLNVPSEVSDCAELTV
jgi:integrase